MTNTVLTNEQIRNLGEEWSCFFPEVGYEDDCIRDIEQAVLQSPEIQAMRKDAERYRWLRENLGFPMDDLEGMGRFHVSQKSGPGEATYYYGQYLDRVIDHSRRGEEDGNKC